LGTWELAVIIAGPIGVVCLVVMIIINFWVGSTKRHNIRYQPTPQNMASDQQPILTAAVSLRDMIEMTTSGSGSGLLSYNFYFLYFKLYYLIYIKFFRVTTFGSKKHCSSNSTWGAYW